MEPVLPLTALALSALALERRRVAASRDSIDIRIHVNGTRGKSTTVRLIAAMLRAQGIRTVAKTTGGRPMYIDSWGISQEWKRKGSARLSEQIRFLRKAAEENVEAVVLECMAVDPYLQYASEHSILKATHTVITNVRDDHREVMGRSLGEAARSLGNSVPTGGHLILGDKQGHEILSWVASDRNTKVSIITDEERAMVVDRLGIDGVRYRGFVECAATATAVARRLGVSVDTITKVLKDWPLPSHVVDRTWQGKRIFVIDALSANDPQSASSLWSNVPESQPAYVIYCHRPDRPLRLQGFLETLRHQTLFRELLICGSISRHHSLLRHYRKHDANNLPVASFGTKQTLSRLEEIVRKVESPWFVFVGNEVGLSKSLATLIGRNKAGDSA